MQTNAALTISSILSFGTVNAKTIQYIDQRIREALKSEIIYLDLEQAIADYLGTMVRISSRGRNIAKISLTAEEIGLPPKSQRVSNINLPTMNLLPQKFRSELANAVERVRHDLSTLGIEHNYYYWIPLRNWQQAKSCFDRESEVIQTLVSDILYTYDGTHVAMMESAENQARESFDNLIQQGVSLEITQEEFIDLFLHKVQENFPSRERIQQTGIELETIRPTAPNVIELIESFHQEWMDTQNGETDKKRLELERLKLDAEADKIKIELEQKRMFQNEERKARQEMLDQRKEIWLRNFDMSSILDDIAQEAGAEIFSLIYSLSTKEISLSAPICRRLKNLLEKWVGACQMVGDDDLYDITLRLQSYLKASSKTRDSNEIVSITHTMAIEMARAGRRRKLFSANIGQNVVRL